MPKVSVVVPCYNHGTFLDEAIASVLSQSHQDYEIVVVDDGSDDAQTLDILDRMNRPNIRVIRTENRGLAHARNQGIKEATGAYILPLDADDKIGKEYLELAVGILDKKSEIGIVYCKAVYFGDQDGLVDLPEFSIDRILKKNIIFCSGVFRKKDWVTVGGYKENMVYGLEDWDFWLSLISLGLKPHRIPQTLFYYRIKKTSMLHAMSDEDQFFMIKNVIFNQRQLFKDCAEIYIVPKVSELYIDTGMGFNSNQVISRVIFGKEGQIDFDLSQTRKIKSLRLDPINDCCVVHIDQIAADYADGLRMEINELDSNAINQSESNFIFATSDPQIYFSVPEGDVRSISINLNFIAIGKNAFDYVLNYQAGLISQQKARITQFEKDAEQAEHFEKQLTSLHRELAQSKSRTQEILASTTWKLARPIRWVFDRANRTSAAILRNQESSFLNEIMFFYHCYMKKNLTPPARFNFVGSPEFVETGKLYHDAILKYCSLERDERLLDIGCGIGRVAIHFMDYLDSGGGYEGFDIVKKGITWCRHKISKKYPNFIFKFVNLYNKEYNPKGVISATDFKFPYPDNSFDVVFATSVFTHMLPEACINYLNEIHRVLRQGKGRALISAFVLDDESKKQMGNGEFNFKKVDDRYGVIVAENPEAAIAFEETYLRRIIEQAGLKIADPIHFGSWSTRDAEIHGQDILILKK